MTYIYINANACGLHTCSSGSARWTIQSDGLVAGLPPRSGLLMISLSTHSEQGLNRLDITTKIEEVPFPRDATWTLKKLGLAPENRLPEQYFFTSREILLQSILDKREKGT